MESTFQVQLLALWGILFSQPPVEGSILTYSRGGHCTWLSCSCCSQTNWEPCNSIRNGSLGIFLRHSLRFVCSGSNDIFPHVRRRTEMGFGCQWKGRRNQHCVLLGEQTPKLGAALPFPSTGRADLCWSKSE